MVTITVVSGTHPETLSAAAGQLGGKVSDVRNRIADQRRTVADLRAGWQGAAADAAIAQADALLGRQETLATRLAAMQNALAAAGTNLTPLKSQILALARQAATLGATVGDDGGVTARPGPLRTGTSLLTPTVAKAYGDCLKAMLQEFDNVDRMTADRLDTARTAVGAALAEQATPTWTGDDLYDGNPSADDINQNALGDCYLAATMGAIAQADPQWIRDRISYDPATGQFDVTLWDGKQWRHIPVTQADVDANIASQGGSGVDTGDPTRPNPGAALWPAVIESAYGKLKAPGKAPYPGIGQGGYTVDAMEALTGNEGTTVEPSQEWYRSLNVDQKIAAAIQNHQPVVLSTSGSVDGTKLIPNHVFTVVGITGSGSDAQVTLRNPWEPTAGGDGRVTIPLSVLMGSGLSGALGNGPVQNFNIGHLG